MSRHHFHFRAVLVVALLSFSVACSSSSMPPDIPTHPHSASAPGGPAEPVFSTQRHADSPVTANDAWRGVLIKAPPVVRLDPRRPGVMVRGVYALSGMQMPPKATLKLLAIDVQTKRRYEAPMGQEDPSPVEPPPARPPLAPEMRARLTFHGHFNVELIATLGLPLASAAYVVWAEVGSTRSNEISVKLQLP